MTKIDPDMISRLPKCYIFDIDGCLADTNDIILSKSDAYVEKMKEYDKAVLKFNKDVDLFNELMHEYQQGIRDVRPIDPIRPQKPEEPTEKPEAMDWDYFESHLNLCRPIWGTIDLLISLSQHCKVFILTGRCERVRSITQDWLRQVIEERVGKETFRRVNYTLIMRDNKDTDPSGKYKQKKLGELTKNYNIQLVIEDHPDVVDIATKMGLLVLRPNTVWKDLKGTDMIYSEVGKAITNPIKVRKVKEEDYDSFDIDTGVEENDFAL